MSAPGPRRIHVVGGSATGKTTAATRIGATLGIPVTHLDAIAWRALERPPFELWDSRYQPSAPVENRPLAERELIIHELSASDAWVTEGKHLWWTEPLFARADLIVWLDHVPTRQAIWRILRRAARSAARESQRHSGVGKVLRPRSYVRHGVELMLQIFRRARYDLDRRTVRPDPDDYRAITRSATVAVLRAHTSRVRRIRSNGDLARLIAELEATAPSSPEPVAPEPAAA